MTSTGAPPDDTRNQRFVATLAYFGGAMTGLVLLAFEKRDPFIRFHAMQSVVTFACVLVAHLALSSVPVVGPPLRLAFLVAVVGLWIALMVKAFQGERYKLPYLGDVAEQFLK
jgi:uncharacterized membrane protein